MSNIKNKKRENDNNKLSKHLQNVKIVIRQELNIIFEKIVQTETKNNNEKIFNYKFNENDVVDYIALVEKK